MPDLGDLMDTPFDAAPAPVLLDRSTIEWYTICPAMGVWCERHPSETSSLAATSGQQVHKIISWGVGEYVASGEPPWENIEPNARMSRPDVQPDVLASIRPSIYSMSKMLMGHNPADVLRYDGGEGERPGQLASEILPANEERGPVLVTSEVDLLLATPALSVLREIDWKTGHTPWTYTDVKESFQFQLHAMLILDVYPDVQRVDIEVWMTRMNRRTAPVSFTRRDADDCRGRCLTAFEERRVALAADHPDTWPADGRCVLCPCVRECGHAARHDVELAANPVEFARNLLLRDTQLKDSLKRLTAWCDKHGNIDAPGVKYGRFPSGRKPTAGFKAAKGAKGAKDDKENDE